MELPATTKDITVEWLNEVLHENGFLGDSNIVSIQHEQIGIGEGFMSDIARITLGYDKPENGLSNTIVAKLPTSFPAARLIGVRDNFYTNEIRFYTDVAPTVPLRTPELIYSCIDEETQNYILLLQDYSHCKKFDMATGANEEQARFIISKLVDFHASWWDANNLYSFQWMRKPDNSVDEIMAKRVGNSIDICLEIEGIEDFLPAGSLEILKKIQEYYEWLLESERTSNLTIRHGDFRITNMFIDPYVTDDYIVVYDWSGVRVSCGIGDLSYFIGWSLTTDTRRKIERDLLKLYWENLHSKITIEYPYEEFTVDYLKGLLEYTAVPVLALTRLDLSSVGGSQGDRYQRIMHRWFDTLIENNAISVLPS